MCLKRIPERLQSPRPHRQLELAILRYGFFYGPGTWYLSEGDMGEQVRKQQLPVIGSGQGVWSFVHSIERITAGRLGPQLSHHAR
jgi:nucleoside-diphosphate-sugar epimerase